MLNHWLTTRPRIHRRLNLAGRFRNVGKRCRVEVGLIAAGSAADAQANRQRFAKVANSCHSPLNSGSTEELGVSAAPSANNSSTTGVAPPLATIESV